MSNVATVAAELAPRTQAFVAGRYVDAADGAAFDKVSPIDGATIARVAQCGAADVDRAVAAARAAFESGAWSETAPRHRKKVLLKFAALVEENAEWLARLETIDMGKPIRFARAVDLPGAVEAIRWYAEAIDKVYDQVAPVKREAMALVVREPIGVVAAIVPWNFPLLMASWKIAPALAAGNSVLLKPAEQSPLTAIRLGELAAAAGIPDGVFSVLPGDGPTTGRLLACHPDVDMIAFTGSTEIGQRLLRYAGETRIKAVSLECGGKSPLVVFDDLRDIDAAAKAVAFGIFFNQGEVCNAASRLVVHRAVKDALLDRVGKIAQRMQPADPLDARTLFGAIVSAEHLARIEAMVASGRAEGATVTLGGERTTVDGAGYYFPPTVFDAVTPRMRIAQEEIFGPVLATQVFDTEEEALALANDSRYGLAASVWTADFARATRFARKLRAGTVWVNTYDEADMATPFGGYKQSGIGRDRSLEALHKYTQLKTQWFSVV